MKLNEQEGRQGGGNECSCSGPMYLLPPGCRVAGLTGSSEFLWARLRPTCEEVPSPAKPAQRRRSDRIWLTRLEPSWVATRRDKIVADSLQTSYL
ncbi:unnamed protein product [Protopolystoma xenopodis]|uniref:Uncharacterized protein n=1 Tax=Protopolystoma xenopodis TaxID=117903 RepID=A0A3S5A8V4_9PLAT|nr:unnamed protein product [Protopolystoma xenopodis]